MWNSDLQTEKMIGQKIQGYVDGDGAFYAIIWEYPHITSGVGIRNIQFLDLEVVWGIGGGYCDSECVLPVTFVEFQ